MKNYHAFTLVELMLAITLSSLFVFGLMHVYLEFKKTNQVINALQAMQERARYAYLLLTDAVHTAGSIDCMVAPQKENFTKIVGYVANNVPAIWHINALRHTDVMIVAGCYKENNKLIYLQKAYYIGNTHRFDRYHRPIYALYVKNLSGNRRELIENVQAMRIDYGIVDSTKKFVSFYLSTINIKSWLQVCAVKISLLLYHIITQKIQHAYWFDQQLIYPKQNYFYQSLNIFAAIRNN